MSMTSWYIILVLTYNVSFLIVVFLPKYLGYRSAMKQLRGSLMKWEETRPKEYHEGMRAVAEGKKLSNNPYYELGSSAGWEAGYRIASNNLMGS